MHVYNSTMWTEYLGPNYLKKIKLQFKLLDWYTKLTKKAKRPQILTSNRLQITETSKNTDYENNINNKVKTLSNSILKVQPANNVVLVNGWSWQNML